MKKIIATVLAMVMALALCTTAFAAPTEVPYGAYQLTTGKTVVADAGAKATFVPAVAAKLDKDGKQTNTANVAYYTLSSSALTGKYVVAASLADADVVLYNNETDKSVVLYLAESKAEYTGSGTVFTNFGDKCGQVKFDGYDKTKTYYSTNDVNDDGIYVADKDGYKALMVDGKLVNVATAVNSTAAAKVQHISVPTVKDGKVVGYTCSVCKIAAIEAANAASVPADAQPVSGTTTWYFPVAGTSAGTTNTTTSPKTFDAGIAMYVGMALTSVAGSAVVIGKKKEF